jgi:hypothetical protein
MTTNSHYPPCTATEHIEYIDVPRTHTAICVPNPPPAPPQTIPTLADGGLVLIAGLIAIIAWRYHA